MVSAEFMIDVVADLLCSPAFQFFGANPSSRRFNILLNDLFFLYVKFSDAMYMEFVLFLKRQDLIARQKKFIYFKYETVRGNAAGFDVQSLILQTAKRLIQIGLDFFQSDYLSPPSLPERDESAYNPPQTGRFY
jgi:hypothetical protein